MKCPLIDDCPGACCCCESIADDDANPLEVLLAAKECRKQARHIEAVWTIPEMKYEDTLVIELLFEKVLIKTIAVQHFPGEYISYVPHADFTDFLDRIEASTECACLPPPMKLYAMAFAPIGEPRREKNTIVRQYAFYGVREK